MPIVIAAALWGPHWHGSCILFRTDNMAVVEVLRSHSALLMHLLRCLVFYASVHHFDILGEHLAGVHNAAADAISRKNLVIHVPTGPPCPSSSICAGFAGEDPARLGITQVDQLVQKFLDQGIAKSTQAVYRSGWQRYSQFCSKHSRPPLPLTEPTLCQFAAVMAQTCSLMGNHPHILMGNHPHLSQCITLFSDKGWPP